MSKLTTHRCKESLKHGVSIRYTTRCDWENEKAWRLFKPEVDFEYNVTHFKHISKIHFCPYCGELLYEVNCLDCTNYNIGDGIDDIAHCHGCQFEECSK